MTSQIKFMASIGHVCLQWALLEMTILAVLDALEDMPHERGAIVWGGLDMLPRFHMAINLAQFHKAPHAIPLELRAIRKALQDGIADGRNQAVHGAHKDSGVLDSVQLTMVRWPEPRRTQTVTLEDMFKLSEDIHALQRRCYAVFEAIGAWKFPNNGAGNSGNNLSHGRADVIADSKIAQRIYASVNRLWRKILN